MESINRQIYNSHRLSVINNEIARWDLNMRRGMQQWRNHDKYGFIELNLYELESYKKEVNKEFSSNYTSNIDWKVDEILFPKELYILHIEELKIYADFITSYISAIKGQHLSFVFEITFAGFHPIDSHRVHTYGKALIEAIISCFDEQSYTLGKLHKEKYLSLESIKYAMKVFK